MRLLLEDGTRLLLQSGDRLLLDGPQPALGAYRSRVIADGASHYWRLDETTGPVAADTIGGVNGTISGGVTIGQPGALSDGNRAMTFDGVAPAKIQTAAGVTVPAAATVEGWIKFTNAAQKPVLALRPETNFLIATRNPPNAGQLQVWTGTFAYGTRLLNDGNWHHIAVVFTGSDCLIYTDGTVDTTTANVHTLQTGPARIGYDQADGLSWLGSLDEVAIYPRALSATEIQAHYNLGLGLLTPPTYSDIVLADQPSHYWRLDEPSGSVAKDIVGGEDGTIVGGVTLNQPGALFAAGKAMTFNGTTGKIVGTLSAIPPVWTFEAWLYQPAEALQQRPFFAVSGGTGDRFYFKLYGDIGQNPIGVQVNYLGAGQINLYSTTGVSTGCWHHAVIVFPGGLVPEIYLDGIRTGLSGSLTQSLVGVTLPSFELGAATAWPQFFSGGLDEIAIYPRALTPDQIRAHYEARALPYLASSYPGRVILDGATAYWRLGEPSGTTAVDLIGGMNGTVSGSVALGAPGVTTDGDKAMTFPGTGHVTIPNGPYAAWGTGPASMECWLKGTLGNAATMYIVDNKVASTVNPGMDIYGDINSLFVAVGNGTATAYVNAPITHRDNKWHHVVGVLERGATDFLRIYVDGVLQNTTTMPAAGWNISSPSVCAIGTYAGDAATSNNHYKGLIDEVAIYSRALTAAEVKAHYDLGRGPATRTYRDRIVADGATNYWRLDEASGTTAVDSIAGANGTIASGVALAQPGALSDGTRAVTLDGTVNGKITVPALTSFPTGPFTIELWVRLTTTAGGLQFLIACTPLNLNFIGIERNSVVWYSRFFFGGVAKNLSGGTTVDFKWHHITVTYDGATVRQYVDAVSIASVAATGSLDVGGAFTIGNYSDGAYGWPGSLDDVVIYPRALSAADIKAHYDLAKQSISWSGVPGRVLIQGDIALEKYNLWEPITPSNTVDLPRGATGGVWVGAGGDVAAVMQSGAMPVVFTAVPSGAWLPIAARRINATGTTATGLIALYEA